jgi:2-amino-4-hydroxy-6-hydroxymethyldihydropteridine diphosphokinase
MPGKTTKRYNSEAHEVLISIGSNIGDKRLNCQNGLLALEASEMSKIKDVSKFYRTAPVDYIEQDWFINAAVKIVTCLDPFQLLKELQSIQERAGRKKDTVRFGPRILDLDIIFYDDLILKADELHIPHPRMHKRRFVLKPICDIAPTFIHPEIKKDMEYLLHKLDDDKQGVVLY